MFNRIVALSRKRCLSPWINCLSSLLLLSACNKVDLELYGSVHGTITDSQTKEPIKGAVVTVSKSGKSCLTGEDGNYVFRDLNIEANNFHTLQVLAENYESSQRSILLEPGDDNRLDFALTPSRAILEVSERTYDFGKQFTNHTINLKNVGFAVLEWEANEDQSWLSCSPTSGKLKRGEQCSLEIKVERKGMDVGGYMDEISISSNGGSANVIVRMEVEGMSVNVAPSELDFGETTTSLTLILESPREVRYFLEASNPWLIPSKTEGLFKGTEYLQVTVDRTNLSSGVVYEGKLLLRVGNDIKEIPVKMTVPSRSAPKVDLYSVKDVSYGSAVFSGGVISIGSSKVDESGYCWSENEVLDIETSMSCKLGGYQSAAALPDYVAVDLKASTDYYVCAYARNSVGIAYSKVHKFKTLDLPSTPTVETGGFTKVTHESATASGNILKVGDDIGITDYGHVWALSSSPTIDNNKTSFGRKDGAGPFTSELTSLSPNKMYYVRAYAINSIGIAYGEEKILVTLPDDMEVSTLSVDNVTHNAATLGGSITYDGGNVIAERGVCWAVQAGPTIEDNHKASSDLTNPFYVRVESLDELTPYYYRAYAIAGTGTVYYGNDVYFSTTHKIYPPQLSAVSVSSIQTGSATVAASVTDDGKGDVNEVGFVYSSSINPTLDDNKVPCGTDVDNFSASLADLADNTTYYVRAYALNQAGVGYGEETFFTTKEIRVPDVSTTEVTSVTYNSASFSANVINVNNGTLKDAGFVYSTSPDPDLNSSRISCGSSEMLISAVATALSANTRYFVRAYATNEKGTSYGESNTFVTSEAPQVPVIETGLVSDIACNSAVVAGEIVKVGVSSGVSGYGHVWSMDPLPDIDDFNTKHGATLSATSYVSTLTDLLPNKTYYVRAYATNELGTSFGSEMSFKTLPDVMLLKTSSAKDITHNAATLSGSITYYGGNNVKEYGVCLSTSPSPDLTSSYKSVSVSGDDICVRVEGLKERTTYYYRTYVISEYETVYYGNDETFTTTHQIHLPRPSALMITDIKVTGATLASSVEYNGAGTISDAGFIYSTSLDLINSGNKVSCGTQTGIFSYQLNNLVENTTYYVCAYIANEAGIGYSDTQTFKTLEINLPDLSAVEVLSYNHRSATFSASVLKLNNGTLIDAGFVYSKSPLPDLGDEKISCGNAGTYISAKATPLEALTTYYVRAYATNEKGTAYSEPQSFTTKDDSEGNDFDMGGFDGEENDWN